MDTHYISEVVKKQDGGKCWSIRLYPVGMWEPLRSLAERATSNPASAKPRTLMQFLRDGGGLDPTYNRGQWRHEIAMIRESGKGVMPGVFNCDSTKTFEEWATICMDAGYIMEPDVDMMLWALSKDVEACAYNEPHNRVYGHDGEAHAVDLDYQRWSESVDDLAEEALAA